MHLLFLINPKKRLKHSSIDGFTLPEILVVFLIVGILAGLALPNWLAFVNTQRLKTAQSEVYSAMKQAQSQASKDKLTWQTSFRENNNIVQWAVHPAAVNPSDANWNNLDADIRLDGETTLQLSNGVRRIQFDYKGNVRQVQLGRITLISKYGGRAKRCVYVSTFLGAMRTAKERNRADSDGDYCY